jgi:hypothetical protein
MSACRDGAVSVKLPNRAKFVLVTAALDHANELEIIPAIAKAVVEEFSAPK